MKKGSGILVSGRLQQRSWEQEGQKRSKVEVVVEDFNFVGGGGGDNSNSGGGSYQKSAPAAAAAPAAKTDAPADAKKAAKPKVDDVSGDEPINLDDIPF